MRTTSLYVSLKDLNLRDLKGCLRPDGAYDAPSGAYMSCDSAWESEVKATRSPEPVARTGRSFGNAVRAPSEARAQAQ
ncbi:hypothetical protein GCM10010272_35490 [Streptomyces lateritius]|nr:hypothetical protein GCM10010272_35490 [Streptomyces lateritius]